MSCVSTMDSRRGSAWCAGGIHRPGSCAADLERAADRLDAAFHADRGGERDPCASGTERTSGQDEQPDVDPSGFGPWFEAQYDGECAGCWGAIDSGDRIRADGSGGYLCDDCGEDGNA